jgi:hypothetical protein
MFRLRLLAVLAFALPLSAQVPLPNTKAIPRMIEPGKPLQLRYAVYVHSGVPIREALQKQWEAFAKTELPDLSGKKK